METDKIYQVIIHDYPNMTSQILGVFSHKQSAEELLDRLNYFFGQNGRSDEIEVTMYTIEDYVVDPDEWEFENEIEVVPPPPKKDNVIKINFSKRD